MNINLYRTLAYIKTKIIYIDINILIFKNINTVLDLTQ